MLKLLILREIRAHVKSARFQMAFALIVVVMAASAAIFCTRYIQLLEDYGREVQENQRDVRDQTGRLCDFAFFRHRVHMRPMPLEMLSEGRRKFLPNSFEVNLFLIDYPERKGRTNDLMGWFSDLDWSFIIVHLFSFLALLLTYDAISGEKEDGTLRLVMSYPVSRDRVIVGKFLGILLVMAGSLLVGLLLHLLIVNAMAPVSLAGDEWLRIAAGAWTSLVFLSLCLLVGLFVSTRCARSSTSMVSLLMIWMILVVVIPPTGRIFASKVYNVPSRRQVQKEIDQARDDIWNTQAGFDVPAERNPGNWSGDPFAPNVPYRSRMVNDMEDVYRRIYSGYIRKLWEQVTRARQFLMVSPAVLYQLAMENVANTGVERFRRFFTQIQRYRTTLEQFVRDVDREDPESAHLLNGWHKECISQRPVDYNRISQFREEDVSPADALMEVRWSLLALVLMGLTMFLLTYISFLRYDVR